MEKQDISLEDMVTIMQCQKLDNYACTEKTKLADQDNGLLFPPIVDAD